MYDLLIIGGGPAGMAAAIVALHKDLDVLLVSKDLGGQTNYQLSLPWVEVPGGSGFSTVRGVEMVHKLRDELEWLHYDCLMEPAKRLRKDPSGGFMLTTDSGEQRSARTAIIASGSRWLPLGVPGEQEYHMRGLSYSAASYAPLFKNHSAAIVGDSNLALRSTAQLASVANQVILVAGHNQMLESPLGERLYQAGNVKIMEGYQVKAVEGDGPPGSGFARRLVLKNPNGAEEQLEVDGIFVEKGLQPNSQMVGGLVHCDSAGRIQVDSMTRTSTEGVFAAGDVTHIYAEQVLIAMGEGAKAALSAFDYLLETL